METARMHSIYVNASRRLFIMQCGLGQGCGYSAAAAATAAVNGETEQKQTVKKILDDPNARY